MARYTRQVKTLAMRTAILSRPLEAKSPAIASIFELTMERAKRYPIRERRTARPGV